MPKTLFGHSKHALDVQSFVLGHPALYFGRSKTFWDFQGVDLETSKIFSGAPPPDPRFLLIKPIIQKRVDINKFFAVNYLINCFWYVL